LIAGYNAIMVHVVVFIFNSWIVCCVFVRVCVCVCVCVSQDLIASLKQIMMMV